MSFIGKALNFVVGGVLGGLLGLNRPNVPKALPQPTRDDALAQVQADDELRRRKGAAADILTGTTGAEAAINSTGKFVPGS